MVLLLGGTNFPFAKICMGSLVPSPIENFVKPMDIQTQSYITEEYSVPAQHQRKTSKAELE